MLEDLPNCTVIYVVWVFVALIIKYNCNYKEVCTGTANRWVILSNKRVYIDLHLLILI